MEARKKKYLDNLNLQRSRASGLVEGEASVRPEASKAGHGRKMPSMLSKGGVSAFKSRKTGCWQEPRTP